MASKDDKPSANKEGRRVLVADDDPAILRLVSAILEKENYAVVSVGDGREAYKILQNDQNFIAAVFDVVMPAHAHSCDDDDRRAGSQALVR